ncbi:MAG: hypothetical protein MK106_14700 [Mariniblastus sp.]|nr:hypothetical protein [Mariniblastus sp.]
MDGSRILITGDYCHADFKSLVPDSAATMTLVPIARFTELDPGRISCDLIVVAQSRRGQFSQADVERIRGLFPLVPIVNLLGSWCEGSIRSGEALDGVELVFWHQWEGRFEEFRRQLGMREIADWQLPATTTHGDRVERRHRERSKMEEPRTAYRIGVYAMTMIQYEMLRDTFGSMGWQTDWMLQDDWDGKEQVGHDAICVDAMSLSPSVVETLLDLQGRFPAIPLVVVLNFPRPQEVDELARMGVNQVVSKPFEHIDLKSAIERALLESTES